MRAVSNAGGIISVMHVNDGLKGEDGLARKHEHSDIGSLGSWEGTTETRVLRASVKMSTHDTETPSRRCRG